MIKYRALFYDNKNKFLGQIESFKATDKSFTYKKGRYNVNLEAPYYERSNLVFHFIKTRYYYYNINNSNPLTFSNNKPLMSPELYEQTYENDFFRQLNNLPKSNWLTDIPLWVWLVLLAGIGIAVYFITKKPAPAQLFLPFLN